MTNIQFAKKVLENIKDNWFKLDVSASTGGKCDDGWGDTFDMEMSKEELLYLLRNRSNHKDLFDGMELKEVDVDSKIYDLTKEAAWPDGGPAPYVNDVIPVELSDIAAELEDLDINNSEEVSRVRDRLKEIEGGKYTFTFTVEASGYTFVEDAEESIELTSSEALGLLYGQYDKESVFEGICNQSYDEDLINGKAEAAGFAEDYDSFGYGGECEQLYAYLDAWDYIIDCIIIGSITEDSLDS